MAVFFQKIEIRHGEFIPERGPILFVANHPNSIMDALVMGVVTKRKVNYIGHFGLFSNKLKSWFLSRCGVIPVYRRVDSPDKMVQNVSMFEACYRALEKGETIGIFPEGTSDMLRKVKKVKTGAARIVLETEERNEYELGLKVIPVGLHFFSRSRFRSKVLLNVGQPIDLSSFFKLNKEDSIEAVHGLTDEIQSNLEKLTVNIQHEELDGLVRDIEFLYRDELEIAAQGRSEDTDATVAEFVLTQKIADCVEYFYARDREKVEVLQDRVNLYKRKLKRLRLKDVMVRETSTFSALKKENLLVLLKSFFGFPIALYGAVNNLIPYFIAENVAKKFVDERTKILTALLLGGGGAFVLFYTVQVSLVFLFFGKLWAGIYFITLPIAGMFTLTYLKEIRIEQERLSLSLFLFTNRHLFTKLRRERKSLIRELERYKDEYLRLLELEHKSNFTNA